MNESPLDPADLTPAQEESVRRLLADARATEPMPDDVRSRLDDVLRELRLPSVELLPHAQDNVVDLAARRRSRAKNLLIAAAAVVAIGVAVPQVLQGNLSANETSASSSADYDSAPESGRGNTTLREDSATGSAPEAEDDAGAQSVPSPDAASARKDLPRLRAQSFVADAEAIRDQFAGRWRSAFADQAYRSSCLQKGDLMLSPAPKSRCAMPNAMHSLSWIQSPAAPSAPRSTSVVSPSHAVRRCSPPADYLKPLTSLFAGNASRLRSVCPDA